MRRALLRRLAAAALLLLLVLTATFALLHLAPGDPTRLVVDPRIAPEQRDAIRALWGLDRPWPEQYGRWLGRLLLHGDWGTSMLYRRPAGEVILGALPTTLALGGAALLVQVGLGLPLGVWSARRAGRRSERALRLASLALYSTPTFWLALLGLLVFSYVWGIFPPSHLRSPGAESWGAWRRGVDLLLHLVLPSLVLGLAGAGGWIRLVRAAVLEALSRPYVRAARARGLAERRVIWNHAVRGASGPLLQILALTVPALLGGALLVEVIFALPGLGRIAYEALLARDGPLVLAATAWSAGLVILGNLAADLALAVLDPRTRGDARPI